MPNGGRRHLHANKRYLSDLKETLEKTREFADMHAKRAQEQYAKF